MEELRRWLPVAQTTLVVAGESQAFLSLETGELYTCDPNYRGQLEGNQNRGHWCRVVAPGPVRTVVAAWDHSFLLLKTGEVYARGDNHFGQLGLGGSRYLSNWSRVPVPGAVRAVVTGRSHSFLLLETGEVYGCGSNTCGQLGLGGVQGTSCEWQRLVVPGLVREIAAGAEHTLLLLETGQVYGCGSDYFYQLGLGRAQNQSTSCEWQRLAVPGGVRKVVASGSYSFLLLETGEVYGCGLNHYGQLGLRGVQNQVTWQRVPVPGTVRTVVAGTEHSFLLLESGEVFACGNNADGRLGTGDTRDRREWQRVPVPGSVRTVAVGDEHSFLLLKTGEVYFCGANQSGQLGMGDTRNISGKWQRVASPAVVRTTVSL
jgi:alpha-tubulin suppressor-like RCC1 family protein